MHVKADGVPESFLTLHTNIHKLHVLSTLVLLYAEGKDLCNIRWLMERTTFLAALKTCLFTKICSFKKSRGKNFK